MVWQKGVVAFSDFFRLFLPSVVNFVVPALLMHSPFREASRRRAQNGQAEDRGAADHRAVRRDHRHRGRVHSFLHLPPVLGMMTGLGYLQLLDYHLAAARPPARQRESDYTFNVFHRIAAVEWDTLLFFYGVMMCVGALGLLGYLTLISQLLYGGLGATAANVLIGVRRQCSTISR